MVIMNSCVALFAASATLGGVISGYDGGVVSFDLVMPQSLTRFSQVLENAPGAGTNNELSTAVVEPGALIGTYRYWVVLGTDTVSDPS